MNKCSAKIQLKLHDISWWFSYIIRIFMLHVHVCDERWISNNGKKTKYNQYIHEIAK